MPAILRGAVLAHTVHGDVAAERSQTFGEGATKATAGPCHQRHLAR